MSSARHLIELPEVPVLGGLASWLAEFEAPPAPRYRVAPDLDVEIVEHAVATAHGPRPGTSFVTRGLGVQGHPELILTWCGPRLLGTPTAAAIAALRAVARAAGLGLEVRAGVAYDLGEGALLEGVGLSGLVFVPAQPMPGLAVPPGALHAIAVTRAELELVARTTVHRLMSRLGQLYGRFPWPAWSCPRRSAGTPGEETVLAQMPRAVVADLAVALDGTTLSIRVPRASTRAFRAALGDPDAMYGHGVVINARPDGACDGHLLWLPERMETEAVSAPRARGRRTAGAFLHVVGGDAVRGTVLEDGFSLALDPDSREALCAAMEGGLAWHERAEAGEVQVTVV